MLNKSIKTKIFKALLAGACAFTLGAPIIGATYQAHAATAYDISEYQGYLTPYEVKRLKHEVSFLVLRVQYGGLVHDSTFNHNAKLLQRYHIPYGVYSYSLYDGSAQARAEADNLHKRAPKAKFYANDLEENHSGNDINQATKAWADEIHKVSNRPAVLYSGEYFMNSKISQSTRNKYNAIWLAAYGVEPNTPYHYDLWQFSSNYYSRALGQALDADTFPDGNNKTLQFWIGNGSKRGPSRRNRSVIQPLNKSTARATAFAQKAAKAKTNIINKQQNSNKQSLSPIDNTANKAQPVVKNENQANKLAQPSSSQNQAQQNQQMQNENNYQNQAMTNTIDSKNNEINEKNHLINSLRQQLRTIKRMLVSDKNMIAHLLTNHAKTENIPKGAKYARSKNDNRAKIVNGYYTSKHINHVRVIYRNGINIYDHNDNKKLAHAKKGEVIHVLYFKPVKFHGHMITRTVGDYGWNSDGSARQVVFTASKAFIHNFEY